MIRWFLLILVVQLFVLLARNNAVYGYRADLLAKVSRAARSDINQGRPGWEWRYDAFQAVDYNRMVWCFWRPLDSFYPDRSFVDPEATSPREAVDR